VLSAGPGWNWPTMIELYPDLGSYTNKLSTLENAVRSNPSSLALQFLLGYHYLVEGHRDAAAGRFEMVTQLQPNDQLSASFVKVLKKASEEPAQPPGQTSAAAGGQLAEAPAPAATAATQPIPPAAAAAEQPGQQPQPPPPPPPPASLVGTWKAQPAADLTITLTLQADGKFVWEVDTKGEKQTLTGQAGFKDNTLALLQKAGPPLVGKVTEQGGNTFLFAPPAATLDKAPGMTFTRS